MLLRPLRFLQLHLLVCLTLATASLAFAADNYPIATFGGTRTVLRSTDSAGVHVPHVIVDSTAAAAGGTVIVSGTFTPAATSHTALDVVGGVVSFSSLGAAGTTVAITSATFEIDGATAEATAWRLCFYPATPASAYADDAAFDYASGDRPWLGCLDLGTAVDQGSTQWIEVHGINKFIKLTGTGIFGYLINLTTLTPAAVAHVATITAVPF